jgi:hypothetical protein
MYADDRCDDLMQQCTQCGCCEVIHTHVLSDPTHPTPTSSTPYRLTLRPFHTTFTTNRRINLRADRFLCGPASPCASALSRSAISRKTSALPSTICIPGPELSSVSSDQLPRSVSSESRPCAKTVARRVYLLRGWELSGVSLMFVMGMGIPEEM